MSELGRALQFPTRTFHKPNHLKDFTARLGLYACKEQRGKAVVVCLHAPHKLLDDYRRQHAPAGAWLQRGWLEAVYEAADQGAAANENPAQGAVPLIAAQPAEEAAQAQQLDADAAGAGQHAQHACQQVRQDPAVQLLEDPGSSDSQAISLLKEGSTIQTCVCHWFNLQSFAILIFCNQCCTWGEAGPH